MKNIIANEIEAPQSSLRNNIAIIFFLVLACSGIAINVIFLNVIQTTLANEGLDNIVIENISRHFTIVGGGITIAGILIVLLISVFLSNTITSPLKQLAAGMISLARGKWDTRIHISNNDELGLLARGFNFMAEHIQESLQRQKEAKEYADNILISVPSILIVLSNRLNVLSTNIAFDNLSEQFPTLSLNQFITLLEKEIHKNLETGETTKKEIIIVPEGSETSLIFSAVVSHIGSYEDNENEEKARVLLTITDITERRKMKELVLQSRQDWEDTFNTIPDMITVHDKDYNIIYANRAAREKLNIPLMDTNRPNKCYTYYHGTDRAPSSCPSCNCLKTEMPSTFEIFEPHLKKYIEIRSIPRMNNNNELIGLIHIVRDISIRKKIEEEHNKLLIAITKAKIEWEMTFDSAMEFIILIDKELKITRCNRSFSNYVGAPSSDIVGNNCYDYFHCPQDIVDGCKNKMDTSGALLTKNEVQTDTGRWLYVSHRPIMDDKANIMKSVIIATDVTQLKNVQQRLTDSENELKKKVEDLEKFYDMAIGREIRMKELKKEIKRLKAGTAEDNNYDFIKG